ncbi:MAG: PLP-dependent aspartate aminotransferase family protein [Coriobacteriales bacterium]|jgi:cystathionine beta-lyase|nr:PLP-dependent aspartate aminotransferase family protein [Coriobacteriales bacterium]
MTAKDSVTTGDSPTTDSSPAAQWQLATRLVHAPGDGDPRFGDVVTPLHLATTFEQTAPGEPIRYDYTRAGNPTRQLVEDQIATLESARYGYAFSSGMAALTAVLSLLDPGDELLIPTNVYGGTFRVLEQYFKRFGLGYHLVDVSDLAATRRALTAHPAVKALLFETPTNPLLTVADIAALSTLAHEHGALSLVDNTFLTPWLQRPLELGADIVVHSATKYLGGHSDVLAGLVALNDTRLAKRLHFILKTTGAVLAPFDSFLLQRGIKTLGVRVDRQCANALALAQWLSKRPEVARVYYPGLASHPGHDIQTRQASGAGGLLAFELAPTIEPRAFTAALSLITLAESLGAVESLICHPATMTHASIPKDLRLKMGISPQLLRIAVGIEHPDDLIADLAKAFETTAAI